ncbi:hypothetical protein ACFVTF_03445 [Kitasatospora sp. NPDC057940]|uniref:hypothetical protein n=1 Tax=Kitasatospora sp. NPDC057940 TaxID=3346285 RepID=UPI0036DD3A83
MTLVHRPRRRTAAAAAAATIIMTLLEIGGIGAGTAHAGTRPPTTNCNPAVDQTWLEVTSLQVDPVVTDFLAVYVAPGTTGQRTETLSRVDSVTTGRQPQRRDQRLGECALPQDRGQGRLLRPRGRSSRAG